MTLYYAAMVLLSIGAFIHSKSPAPEMRPESEAASTFWLWLSRAAFVTWIALIVWGFRELHWSQPVAAVMVSLVGNAVIAMRGPRNAWPLLSMLFSGLGLAAAAIILFGWDPPG
ncbi:MAG: multidrug DMT transporter permease [Alphaproteobacteria bacterium]